MSATVTETNEQTSTPEMSVLARVASIPMISSSLVAVNDALAANAYLAKPYETAKGLSTSAYKLTEPLQVKLAPLIVRADGYANKAVDAVESRYPYPFKAQPEEVVNYVLEQKENTTHYVKEQVNTVNKAFEDKVTTPALHVAQDIDQRFAPLVDYIEGAVSRFNGSEASTSTPPDAQYQYQRALALSKTLRSNLAGYTSEQIKQLQAQSLLAQRASETAQNITSTASSAQTRILTLSDNMLSELQKLQESTKTFAASLQANIQAKVPQIQQDLQQSYTELSATLQAVAQDFTTVLKDKDLPMQDKVARLGKEVGERVQPILENVKKSIADILSRTKSASQPPSPTVPEQKFDEKAEKAEESTTNGEAVSSE